MNCFIFDIDGVITDLKEKKFKEKKIIDILSSQLEKSIPLIFITGRSIAWVKLNVLPYLEEKVSNKKLLDNVLVLGEFDEDKIVFENGTLVNETSSISPPESLMKKAGEATNRYSDIMFVDKTKKTQFTSEVKENIDLEKHFKPQQKKLAKEYQKIVDEHNLTGKFVVHKDRLGTNIRSEKTNKSNAIKSALDWLDARELHVAHFFVFGDSKSDLEMADELRRQNKDFKFAYVGDKKDVQDQNLSGIDFTKKKFEKGTLEYLASLGLH